MAPVALHDTLQSHAFREPVQVKKAPVLPSTKPAPELKPLNGAELDQNSDYIDAVNEYLGMNKDAPRPIATDDDSWKAEQSKFDAEKDKAQFRNYEQAMDHVKAFYKEQHEKQTVAYNIAARKKYIGQIHARMTVWQAIEKLNELVDDSDPDTSLSQIQHLLQTAEAMRRDGKPDWMQLTGLLHDLGKLLCFFGAEQWSVVGDTFVVGARFSDKNVYPVTFEGNPDHHDERYNTELGIYQPNCGLSNVMISWGHDEYLYARLKEQSSIPKAGLYMIRYHSFYPWHREGAYRHFHDLEGEDEEALEAVKAFNAYDLYSKSDNPPDPVALRPYYEGLIDKYFGSRDKIIDW